MNTLAVSSLLTDASGFKPLFKGLFASTKARKSFEIYSNANKKGVYPLIRVRRDKHNDIEYGIYVFSPTTQITSATLSAVAECLATVNIDTIIYDSFRYSRLEPYRGQEYSLASEINSITSIVTECPDIFVFPVAFDATYDYVIYAQKDNEDFIFPITQKQADSVAL